MTRPPFAFTVFTLLLAVPLFEGSVAPARDGAAAQSETFDAWVGFTDKGPVTEAAMAARLRAAERALEPKALERRRLRRTLPGLVDESDLPLHGPYVDAVAATGAEVRVRSRWMNGVTVLGSREQLQAIERLFFVDEVRDVHAHVPKAMRTGRVPTDPDLMAFEPARGESRYGWSAEQIEQLGLPALHAAGYTGEGVRIAVIDTGFLLSHLAFNGPSGSIRVVAQWDFMDADSIAGVEADDSPVQHEHGTLVLGTVAANVPGILVGSAPDAEYILLKAEDEATEYFLEERWFVAALEYAEAHGADIITSSVVLYEGYGPGDVDGATSVMARGWQRALDNGVIGLQGAGNSGHDADPDTHHMLPPAAVPDLITVGAVRSDGDIARFSSDGRVTEGRGKPELLARGAGTVTVSPYHTDALTLASGTSVATPLLAGGVACVLQAHPDWSVEELRQALFAAGGDYLAEGAPDPLGVRGFGIPELPRAAGIGR